MNDEPGVAVVSGAGTGIGRAVALALAARGFRLALLGRSESSLAGTLALANGRGAGFPCDVRDGEALRARAAEIVAALGAVSVLAPCAGAATVASLEETTPAAFAEIVETNLSGAFHLIHAFLPLLRQRERSWIFPVLSVAALRGFPGWGAYCASKWGLRGLLAVAREELKDTGVRLTAIYPGATSTGLWDRLPGTWDRAAMVPAEDVAAAIGWALDVGPGTVLEEVHLGPVGGAL